MPEDVDRIVVETLQAEHYIQVFVTEHARGCIMYMHEVICSSTTSLGQDLTKRSVNTQNIAQYNPE